MVTLIGLRLLCTSGRSYRHRMGRLLLGGVTAPQDAQIRRPTVSRFREIILTPYRVGRATRPWRETVLPFNLAASVLVTPHDWSLTEETRIVRLPGAEPIS